MGRIDSRVVEEIGVALEDLLCDAEQDAADEHLAGEVEAERPGVVGEQETAGGDADARDGRDLLVDHQ